MLKSFLSSLITTFSSSVTACALNRIDLLCFVHEAIERENEDGELIKESEYKEFEGDLCKDASFVRGERAGGDIVAMVQIFG